jgi:hypothetical protein
MRRFELEHIIRASSKITGERDIVVIGSQAVLGQFPEAPDALLVSVEADVFPRSRPELSIEIDGAIGEKSHFHETFGFYAHGVDPTTAVLPEGWEQRLVRVENDNTGGAAGWCLEIHDLALAKLVAGREKDFKFVKVLIEHKMIDTARLNYLVDALRIDPSRKSLILHHISALQVRVSRS